MSEPTLETGSESPRIQKLRDNIIRMIPRAPNNKASLQHMQGKNTRDLITDYISWRSRYVSRRPRTVSIEQEASNDPRWQRCSKGIEALLDKVKVGADLDPYISAIPSTIGYSLAAYAPNATSKDRWSDKDFILNVMGFHHFHLGLEMKGNNRVNRTKELIFAEVRRDTFRVVAVFDHSVFKKDSSERKRLWWLHDREISRGCPPGSFVIAPPIATSGHPVLVGLYATDCFRVIREVESKLEDVEFVKTLYKTPDLAPTNPRFSWEFRHLDLTLLDGVQHRIVFRRGWKEGW